MNLRLRKDLGDGEMVQLRTVASLPEDPDLITSTHIRPLTTDDNSISVKEAGFSLLPSSGIYVHMHIEACTHIYINCVGVGRIKHAKRHS